MKKVVLVGSGARGLNMFAKPLVEELKEHVEFCGVFDKNILRAKILSEQCGGVQVFSDFQQMLESVKPDSVVIASTDDTHHIYIIAAMEAGCDVISEKPMTIDAEKCKAIFEAEQRTGQRLTVIFNMRFVPYVARIKELLMESIIGEVYHVSLEWYLDRNHGADYFRRWHAQIEHSGGLLVHKSTHHFDMINWWLDSTPRQVFANGLLKFYGPNRQERGVRCLSCNYKETCEFFRDFSQDEFLNRYYLQVEQGDGYIRDQCVFGDRINIYDTMSVNVKYNNEAQLTYSLVAYSPIEGWKATLSGSKGRMEVENILSGPKTDIEKNVIRIFKASGELVEYDVPVSDGEHGGSDERLRRMLFAGDREDPLQQQAGSRAGALSLIIGAAANISIYTGQSIEISDLLE